MQNIFLELVCLTSKIYNNYVYTGIDTVKSNDKVMLSGCYMTITHPRSYRYHCNTRH